MLVIMNVALLGVLRWFERNLGMTTQHPVRIAWVHLQRQEFFEQLMIPKWFSPDRAPHQALSEMKLELSPLVSERIRGAYFHQSLLDFLMESPISNESVNAHGQCCCETWL